MIWRKYWKFYGEPTLVSTALVRGAGEIIER